MEAFDCALGSQVDDVNDLSAVCCCSRLTTVVVTGMLRGRLSARAGTGSPPTSTPIAAFILSAFSSNAGRLAEIGAPSHARAVPTVNHGLSLSRRRHKRGPPGLRLLLSQPHSRKVSEVTSWHFSTSERAGRARRSCFPIATIATAVPRCRPNRLRPHRQRTADDGTPVAGASVTLSGRVGRDDRADGHRGHFPPRTAAGTYSLRAEAPGYAPLSEQTVMIAGAGVSLALVLSPATTNSLTVIGQVQASAGRPFRPRRHRA